jgi:hypothetical protein
MVTKTFVSALLLLSALLFSAHIAQAQLDPPGEPKFKVGDRVEYDSRQAMDPANAVWVKATVVRIEVAKISSTQTQTSYVIKFDSGGEQSVTRKHAEEGHGWAASKPTAFLRPLAGGDATPPQNVDQPPNNNAAGPPNGPPAPNNAAAVGKYKKGDCVDFDVLETAEATRAEWKPGKIVDVQIVKLSSTQTQTNYVVQLDQPGPTGLPQRSTISQRLAEGGMTYAGDPNRNTGFLRPRGCDGAAPTLETSKLHLDQNGNVTADRPLLDCDNLKTGPARNGQRPDPELMKKIIRCLWEDPGKPGLRAPRKIDIAEFVQGGTRRWNVNNDMGSGATIDTVVYQFRVKYDSTTFNREDNEVELGHQGLFKCWVGLDKWQCGEDDIIKWGQTKRIAVTQ